MGLDGGQSNEVSGHIIDAALKVHSALGPGLLESAYEACMLFELHRRGLRAVAQVELPIVYESVRIDAGYRIDLLVEELVVVEIKACASLLPVHEAQIISYLKLSSKPIGLLINFHVVQLKDGLKRFVNHV
jgi:GxxExxY protein